MNIYAWSLLVTSTDDILMPGTQIQWEFGTAYDVFISLDVIFHPAEFDVRGAWAAGVRARIPASYRTILEQSLEMVHIPFSWIFQLPEPKDVNSVLWALRQLSAPERLPTLALRPDSSSGYRDFLLNIWENRKWDERDLDSFDTLYRQDAQIHDKRPLSKQSLSIILEWWAHADEFGERYLDALGFYSDVFFQTEERRIRPVLQAALSSAREKAERVSVTDLLEELTQGVRFEELPEAGQIVLAPSFWSTPLVYFGGLPDGRSIFVFGARPAESSIIPGEKTPDGLLRVLKALSDPTRLQIMQYLSEQPLSPTQLSHRLRLRVPTLVHHLKVLRLAGLVRLTLGEKTQTKHYAARPEAISAAFTSLDHFIHKS